MAWSLLDSEATPSVNGSIIKISETQVILWEVGKVSRVDIINNALVITELHDPPFLFNSFLSSAIHYDSTASIVGIRFISSADESIFKASVSTAGISVIAESANTNELIRDLLADDDSVILNDMILTDTNTGYLMYYVSRNPNANDFNYVITFDSSLTLGTPTEVHSWGASLGAFG
jgi:hypothetical protein